MDRIHAFVVRYAAYITVSLTVATALITGANWVRQADLTRLTAQDAAEEKQIDELSREVSDIRRHQIQNEDRITVLEHHPIEVK